MGINQTERKDNLVLSLEAAIRTSNLPFYIYVLYLRRFLL